MQPEDCITTNTTNAAAATTTTITMAIKRTGTMLITMDIYHKLLKMASCSVKNIRNINTTTVFNKIFCLTKYHILPVPGVKKTRTTSFNSNNTGQQRFFPHEEECF